MQIVVLWHKTVRDKVVLWHKTHQKCKLLSYAIRQCVGVKLSYGIRHNKMQIVVLCHKTVRGSQVVLCHKTHVKCKLNAWESSCLRLNK